jgi:hypothetical protein
MLFRPRPLVVNMAAEAQQKNAGADTGSRAGNRGRGSGAGLGPASCNDLSNRVRAEQLIRAVQASVSGSSHEISDLYTEDVQGWSPNGTVTSSAELAVEFEDRDDAFSDVQITVVALDVGSDQACVEWVASVLHTGPLTLDGAALVDPTGRRLTLRGVTVAEFDGDRIRSFRQYWNELEWIDQLQRLEDADEERGE